MAPPGDAKGFTLVELLLALTIFAIGLLALASMQFTAIRTNSSANLRTAKVALGQGIMDEILSWRPDDPRLNSDSTDNVWNFPGGATTLDLPGSGSYSATYSVDAPPATGMPLTADVSVVTVTVSGQGPAVTFSELKKVVN